MICILYHTGYKDFMYLSKSLDEPSLPVILLYIRFRMLAMS